MTKTIAMLWTEARVSYLEELAMRSVLAAGQRLCVYTEDENSGLPNGAELRPVSEIMELETKAWPDRPGYLVDRFRYVLLSRRPEVIWSDTDVVWRGAPQSATGHVFGFEGKGVVGPGVLGLPVESEALERLLALTSDAHRIPPHLSDETRAALRAARDDGKPYHIADLPWGTWGAGALTWALGLSGEIHHARSGRTFAPLAFRDRSLLLTPGASLDAHLTEETLAVRMFSRALGADLARNDGLPPEGSPLDRLLEAHGIDPRAAPLQPRPMARRRKRRAIDWSDAAPAANVAIRPLDNVVAVTSMRNEGAFILDWLAYHLSIGVTHFLVYTNECDDHTDAILNALAARGLVTRETNPASEDAKPQRAALDAAWRHPVVQEADAVVVMDVDEFINVHLGQGRLCDLFHAAGDPDMISMTWRLFGSSGETDYDDRPVPERFTRAAPRESETPPHTRGFKTIFRRGAPFKGLGVHRPHKPKGAMPLWVNGSGDPMPDSYLSKGWRSGSDAYGADLVSLNHYAIRSVESFLVKRDRGLDNQPDRHHGIDYWNRFNRNEAEDLSILPRFAAAQSLRASFAADPVLGTLHDAAVAWHRARIADLKSLEGEAALFAHLAADPLAHDRSEIDLPGEIALPRTRITELEGMAIKDDPPVMGLVAEDQFRGLMARTQARHGLLSPLADPPRSDRVVIVSSMKNEGCFILEWIAYHMSIGVTHFVIYTNDCDDPTDAILDRLAVLGHVTRIDNPFNAANGQKPQRGALNDAAARPEVVLADWVGVIDVDEFVNIHVGDGTFRALLDESQHPNVISMTWRFFGNRGVPRFEDKWQTEQFTRCAPLYLPKPRLGWGFKSFFRPDGAFSKLGVHRPLDLDQSRADEVRWVNGAGREMPERVARKAEWFSRKDTIGYDMVTLNHYVLRSAESFLVKRQRGRINHVDQDQGLQYWAARNYASETDTSIQAHLPRARDALARILQDETLAKLHDRAVAWHQRKIEDLLKLEDYQALYRAITNPRLPDAIWRAQESKEDVLAAE